MQKSLYVEIFAIILIVFSVLSIIAASFGFFYTKDIPSKFIDEGVSIPSAVYTGIYALLGILLLYHILLFFTSTCLLVLNNKR